MLQFLKESSNLLWIVVHSFTESLRSEGLPIGISVHFKCNCMGQEYGQVIIFFDGYTSTSTKRMSQQILAGEKVGATVTSTDDKKLKIKKDYFCKQKQLTVLH